MSLSKRFRSRKCEMMLEITYLNEANQEKTIHFDSYEEFNRSQQACMIEAADHYPVVKVTYNGHSLDYHGRYGDLYFYLLKQDLTKFA